MTSYVNQYGTEFAVQKHDGAPALMRRQRNSSQWTKSGTLASLVGDAKTEKDLQAVLDQAAQDKGWEPVRGFPDWELPMVQEILTWPWMPKTAEEFTSSFFKSCDAVRAHEGGSCATGLYDTGPQGIKFSKFYQDGRLYAEHTWADFVRRCIAQGIAPVPNADPISAAPASRADAGAAAQSLCTAGPASLEAKDMNVPAFDYSGLDLPTRDTLHWAEKEIGEARRDYIARLAQAVSIAHDALCSGVVQNLDNSKHGNRGENAFANWCESVGIKRSTAYNLLQVQALLSGSTPEEQATLEAASPSLLYAAAKPSAPAELVQAVKDGDITTHKQYQEALAEIRARDAKIKDLLEMSEAADRRAEEEERKRKEANEGYAAAMETLRQAQEDAADADARARAAENRAAGTQKLADQRATENAELKAKLRALESRPVEVAVTQPGAEQIEAWRKEGEARILSRAKDLAGKARQAQQQAECHASDLEEENNRLRDALNRTRQLDQSAAMACGTCSAALEAWFETTARDVPADLGPALTRMKRLRLALDIAIENGVWPDAAALDDLEAQDDDG